MTDQGIEAIRWHDGVLYLLDQRRLPAVTEYLRVDTVETAATAIAQMVVRGAPAIGITAAYAVVLAARQRQQEAGPEWAGRLGMDLQRLRAARPTAVNLAWAVDRMQRILERERPETPDRLEQEARAIHDEDIAANRKMAQWGAALITSRTAVVTHCNTGALATGGGGTALGVIIEAFRQGKITEVFADETRPWLQGARLTAWELCELGIPVRIITDGAAASLLRRQGVGWAVVGADRIAANGDVANKIGTYNLAIAARHHGVKFMVVAPTSTIDADMASGAEIPIEERAADEVLAVAGQRVADPRAGAWNPVFDVTPAELITAIVTEKGVVHNPDPLRIRALLDQP